MNENENEIQSIKKTSRRRRKTSESELDSTSSAPLENSFSDDPNAPSPESRETENQHRKTALSRKRTPRSSVEKAREDEIAASKVSARDGKVGGETKTSPAQAPMQSVSDYVIEKLKNDAAEQEKSAEPVNYAAIKKQFRKKKTEVPQYSKVRRFHPDVKTGLSSSQVDERFSQFLFNDTNQKYSKSYASIFMGNIFTFFNLLCVLAAVALVYSEASPSQFLFVVIFALNLGFSVVTEIIAKRKIDKLSLLTVPTTTVVRDGELTEIHAKDIVLDDILELSLGNQIPADCIVAEGTVEVNEALLTGESVPVKKEPGDMLYAGSFISSGSCRARADKVGKNTYLNSLSAKAKKYKKPNSELMRSTKLIIRIIGLLIIPVAAGMFFVNYNNYVPNENITKLNDTIQRTVSIVIGMIPSGMLLLTSIALTLGIIRLMTQNTLVQDLYSLEMLARVNVLCLDKTGTITDGRMKVNDCMLLNNPTDFTINEIVGSCLKALPDNNQTSIALYNYFGHCAALKPLAVMPFSSKRKLSAVTFAEIGTISIGAPEFVLGTVPEKINRIVNQYASMGLRVLIVAISNGKIAGDHLPTGFKPLAIISISDNIRDDAAQTIRWFKENDVAVKIISGDNPVTVSEVARRVGVANSDKYISLEGLNEKEVASIANKYTVFGRVTPEQKAILVKAIKSEGNTVAMTGDGVNDILAMKEADCAVSVASGSEAAKNVSHIVLMDNNFASMPKVVFEGRRVINNIQNSSSLYLMKTLFTTIFAILSIIFFAPYPFKTNNLMLLEFFVIGIPTFFLSLQPNTNRVKGKFLPSVLSRAIPCAVVLVLAVQATNVVTALQPGYFENYYEEISVYIISFAGLVMLYRVCMPLNVYRTVLFLSMTAACILGLTLMPNTFLGASHDPLNFVCVLYIIVVILLCVPLSGVFIRIFDRLRGGKSINER